MLFFLLLVFPDYHTNNLFVYVDNPACQENMLQDAPIPKFFVEVAGQNYDLQHNQIDPLSHFQQKKVSNYPGWAIVLLRFLYTQNLHCRESVLLGSVCNLSKSTRDTRHYAKECVINLALGHFS